MSIFENLRPTFVLFSFFGIIIYNVENCLKEFHFFFCHKKKMLNHIQSETEALIIASLSFVAALAWNAAFQNLFASTPLLNKGGPWIYAVAVTLIGIAITSALRSRGKKENEAQD